MTPNDFLSSEQSTSGLRLGPKGEEEACSVLKRGQEESVVGKFFFLCHHCIPFIYIMYCILDIINLQWLVYLFTDLQPLLFSM